MSTELTVTLGLDGASLTYGAGIRDAVAASVGGRAFVYTVTGSGGLTSLELQVDGSLRVVDQMPLGGDFAIGDEPRLVWSDISGGPALVFSGQTDPQSRVIYVSSDGRFSGSGSLGDGTSVLRHPIIGSMPDAEYLVAAGPNGDGLQSWQLSNGGSTPAFILSASSERFLASISATATVTLADATYIVTASSTDAAVSVVALGPGGTLELTGDIGPSDGLGIAGATAVTTATSGERHFAIVAGANSNSLSVIEILAGGVPIVRDHIVDALTTRFAGVEALATLEAAGRVFVAVGGSDDGVSLFALAPTGRLIHLASIADTVSTTLRDVSAIALAEVGGALRIVASGLGEGGVTVLELPLSQIGVTIGATGMSDLSGGPGDDVLAGDGNANVIAGGAGNDVLIDGGASDRMTGHAGADIFVFEADGQPDTVTDFEEGIDRLDLSSFGRLYAPSQLTAVPQNWGVRLLWQNETIDLFSASGGPIDIAAWDPEDITVLDRPGFISISQRLVGTSADDIITGGEGVDTILGGAGVDVLRGEGGNDEIDAGTGNDSVRGGTGDDILLGGGGFDTIEGGEGADTIHGGNEADTLFGDAGDDRLFGEVGVDNLFAGAGNDVADGGSENDRIWGGAGNDTLYGGTQEDRLFGEAGDDELHGGAGFDRLEGGPGNDRLFGGNQADNLFGQSGDDELWGENGFDRLFGGAGNDWAHGGDGPDSLFGDDGNDSLHGGPGNDRFFGGSGNDAIFGADGDDTIWGGAGFDRIDGGPGSDILEGNFNADVFVFRNGDGADVIADFEATNAFEKIDLRGYAEIVGFADLAENHLTASGSHAVIDAGSGDSITLRNVALADLDESDFLF